LRYALASARKPVAERIGVKANVDAGSRDSNGLMCSNSTCAKRHTKMYSHTNKAARMLSMPWCRDKMPGKQQEQHISSGASLCACRETKLKAQDAFQEFILG